tara:strand:+ start:7974 stop:8468 length:495 start_codon:yes stop_codon:yes gene_type:complete
MSLTGNQTRKTYSFKSSGKTKADIKAQIPDTPTKLPIGIRTPLQISRGSGLFEMHTDLARQISDNLRNLILTNHGERLGFYDFGANLRSLVFDLGQEAADEQAIERIRNTVDKYMPFVSLGGFQVFIDRFDNKQVAKVGIQITYSVPLLEEAVRTMEVMLYVGG